MADPEAELDNINLNLQDENLADLIYNAEITDKPTYADDQQDNEQKATIEELASVLLYPEEIPKDSKREFARNLYRSFRSCQMFMSILGRFPVVSYEKHDHSIVFEYNWNSIKGSFFFVTFAVLIILTLLSCLNIISTMLNFPSQPSDGVTTVWRLTAKKDPAASPSSAKQIIVEWESVFGQTLEYPKWPISIDDSFTRNRTQKHLRAEEMFYFRRNLASIMIILFLMIHVVWSDINLYHRRHFVASYLTFWTESVEIMKIDAAGEAKRFAKKFLVYYILWFILLLAVVVVNISPVSSGAPVSFTFLWIRFIYPQIHSTDQVGILALRCFGGFVFLYVILCSKVYVFFFLYICKILKTACNVWNERLERVFSQDERKKSRKEKCAGRTGYDHLFKDFVNLLDLISGADTVFANIIESYFSMTLISIVFEVYYLVRPIANRQKDFSNARTFDMLVIGLFLFNSLMIFYLVSTGAAAVGEAAANGLEIIRRQGIMGHRSDSEMHFMISLYMSYTGHFDTALQGGGYFILDKAFFVAIAGTMISYIIIIFQFQPSLALSNAAHQKELFGGDIATLQLEQAILIHHTENTFYYEEDRPPVT